MAFFDDKSKKEPQEGVVEKIKLGDEEFDPEELKSIVDKGKFALEVEEKYNTKIDKVWPEYTKATQKLKEYEEKEKQWVEKEQKQTETLPDDQLSEEQLRQRAKVEAKRLGLATMEDLDTYVAYKLDTMKQAEDLLGQCKELEKEFNGEDGKPKFATQDILSFMQESGIRDPKIAYKIKNEEQLEKWKESQLNSAKKKGLYTEDGSGGNHEPPQVKLNNQNLQDALKEVLYPSDRE